MVHPDRLRAIAGIYNWRRKSITSAAERRSAINAVRPDSYDPPVLPSLCFWHPVGPHGGETLSQIQKRKLSDVGAHGFTLWSFSPATPLRVYAWRSELRRADVTETSVLCCGNKTADPSRKNGEVRWLGEYSEDLLVWKPLPHPKMTSYHRGPTKAGFVASAFHVTAIEVPQETTIERPKTWFRANGASWEHGVVPTRGEYLVRRPTEKPEGMKVRLVLSVTYPYVVWLR